MTLGERITKQRVKLNMSQAELAKKIGYSSRSSMTMIEADERDLPYSKVVPLANALNVSIAYLLGWEDEEGNDLTNASPIDKLKAELGVDEFTEDEKKEIIKYIKYIVSQREK